MEVTCEKCKGLIKDCPDCTSIEDRFKHLHEEAKKSATYKAEMHFLKVHDIIIQLEQENKALKEKVEALGELVEEAYNTGYDSGQYYNNTGGWKSIEDKLKEMRG